MAKIHPCVRTRGDSHLAMLIIIHILARFIYEVSNFFADLRTLCLYLCLCRILCRQPSLPHIGIILYQLGKLTLTEHRPPQIVTRRVAHDTKVTIDCSQRSLTVAQVHLTKFLLHPLKCPIRYILTIWFDKHTKELHTSVDLLHMYLPAMQFQP